MVIINDGENNICIIFLILEKYRICTQTITEKSDRSQSKVLSAARIIVNNAAYVVGFLYREILNCHSDFTLHLFILMSKKLRVSFCSFSSVKSLFWEKVIISSRISLTFVCVRLCTIRISSNVHKVTNYSILCQNMKIIGMF
jgi:hypothetical protein